MQDHRSVFGRMGAAFGIRLGDEEAAAAGQLIKVVKDPKGKKAIATLFPER